MNDVLVLAVVLLLVASGYAAGRVHAEIGYRAGYRLGYRQGHADASRFRVGKEPSATLQVAEAEPRDTSERRQMSRVVGAIAHGLRPGRG